MHVLRKRSFLRDTEDKSVRLITFDEIDNLLLKQIKTLGVDGG